MCIHDQCDTILVSVDQRIIMPRSPPLRAQQTVQSEHQHYQPRNFPKPVPGQATRQPGRARPGERRGQWGQRRAGSPRVECGHCSGDREPLTRPAALIRHGQALAEREKSEGTNPGDEAAAAAKGEPSAAPAGASPARLIVNSHMINLSA